MQSRGRVLSARRSQGDAASHACRASYIHCVRMCIWGGKGVEGRLLSETLDGKEYKRNYCPFDTRETLSGWASHSFSYFKAMRTGAPTQRPEGHLFRFSTCFLGLLLLSPHLVNCFALLLHQSGGEAKEATQHTAEEGGRKGGERLKSLSSFAWEKEAFLW